MGSISIKLLHILFGVALIYRGVVISFFEQMKQKQADLERQLAKERRAIQAKHDEKVKVAQARSDFFIL